MNFKSLRGKVIKLTILKHFYPYNTAEKKNNFELANALISCLLSYFITQFM